KRGDAGTPGGPDNLLGAYAGPAGATDQPGAGHGSSGRLVAVADRARAGIRDPRVGDAALSGHAIARPHRAAEYPGVPQWPIAAAMGTRPRRRQPRKRTQPRNPATVEPDGAALKLVSDPIVRHSRESGNLGQATSRLPPVQARG